MRRSAHVVGIHSVNVFLYRWFGVQDMTRESHVVDLSHD